MLESCGELVMTSLEGLLGSSTTLLEMSSKWGESAKKSSLDHKRAAAGLKGGDMALLSSDTEEIKIFGGGLALSLWNM